MTNRNLNIFAKNKWYSFWKNLKQGFDAFERTNIPPRINVCGKQYLVEDAGPDELIQQKPMRKLRMIKVGQKPVDGETCFAPPEESETASGTGDVNSATPKGSMQQTSTSHERTKS
jgi:murein L,D-transpeptidase YafK